jgi:hypothetical protein
MPLRIDRAQERIRLRGEFRAEYVDQVKAELEQCIEQGSQAAGIAFICDTFLPPIDFALRTAISRSQRLL